MVLMNDQNPYAASQTPLVNHEHRREQPQDALGKPEDYLQFRVGALLWLISCVAMVAACILMNWLLIGGVLFAMLVGTYLLATIPAKTPGRYCFRCSFVLQLLSPVIALQAIQDVSDPDWDRFSWYQRLGFWGEFLALLCALVGLCRLATWLQFSVLRWSTKAAAVLLVGILLFDAWARSQSFGYEAILYGLIFGFCGVLPFFILLLVCWIGGLFVPYYVGLPITSPYDPHALPATIEIPESLRGDNPE